MAPTLRARKPAPAPAPAVPATTTATTKSTASKAKATTAKPKATSTTTKSAKSKQGAIGAADKAAPKPAAKAATKAKAAPKTKAPSKSAASKAKAAPKAKASKGKAAAPEAKPVTVALDHKAYPHIFDAIVSVAPRDSLLVLRATSHTLLERCDALLARHIVLGPGLPPPKGKKWDSTAPYLPRGPAKKRPRQHRVNLTTPSGALPGWVCDLNHINDWYDDTCGEDCTTLRERWAEYFAEDTRILDLHPWIHSGQKFHRAKELFKGVDIVRFYPYSTERLPVPSESVVVFTTFSAPEGLIPEAWEDWERVTTSPGVYLDSEPKVQRLVFHALVDCRRPKLPECWVSIPTQFGGWHWPHAVVILELEEGTPNEPSDKWDKANPRPNGVLWDVANTLRVGSTTCWTIVGASEIPHQVCGVPHDEDRTHDEFAAAVTENVVKWVREDYSGRLRPEVLTEEREKVIRSSLRFRTIEQYRAEVGEEQWAIDAVRSIKVT